MTMVHAWFSPATAIRDGSSLYRKPSGASVNVTRTNADRQSKAHYPHGESYLGEVIAIQDGGCIRSALRVRGITD